MNRFLTIVIYLLITHTSFAEKINDANHGINPGKDVSFEVNRLLESLKGKKGFVPPRRGVPGN